MRRNSIDVIALSYLTMAFLYLPLLGVAVFSVNDARRGLVWKGFTFKWYLKLFENQWILEAAWNTLLLAVISTIIATVLGMVCTALGLGISYVHELPTGPSIILLAAVCYLASEEAGMVNATTLSVDGGWTAW